MFRRILVAVSLPLMVTLAAAQVVFESSFEYTALVGPDGTTVQTTAANGTSLTLSFPPGAVFHDTPISIGPVDVAAGELPRFRLQPAGIRLHEEITVNIVPGSGIDVNDTSVSIESGGERIALPFTVEPGGVIALTLRSFGFDTSIPNKGQGGTFLNLEQIDCQLELTNLNVRLEMATQFQFSVDSVDQLVLQHKATEQCFLEIDPGALTLTEAAIQQAACEANAEALVDLDLDLQFVDDVSSMRQRASSVLGSEGSIVYFDAPCATAGQAIPAIEGAYQTFAANFRDRVASPDFLSGTGAWPTQWSQEFDQAIGLLEDAVTMGLTPVEAQTSDFLLPEILDQFRVAAYRACEEDNTQQYLADVKSAGHLYNHPISGTPEVPLWANFSSDDVARDIQYCRSQLDVNVYDDALATPLPDQDAELGGSEPGNHASQADVEIPPDGFIELDGSVTALFCAFGPGAAQFASDQLVIRADDEVLGTLTASAGELLSSPFDVSVEQVLDSLGLPDTGGSFALTVTRMSPACGGSYGPAEFELFRIDVDAVEPCPPGGKGAGPACTGFAVLLDHESLVDYEASAELNDTVNGTPVLKTIEVDEEFRHPDGDLDPFSISLDAAPNTSKLISSADGASRSIEIEGSHQSIPTVVDGKLAEYSVVTDVTLTATSAGYQSGVSDYADVDLQAAGDINFEVIGAPVYGTLNFSVAQTGSASVNSTSDTTVTLTIEQENGGDIIQLQDDASADLTFLPGSDDHGVRFNLWVQARARFTSETVPGSATANLGMTITLTLDP